MKGLNMEFRNESEHEFADISSEAWRKYRFPDGDVVINEPQHLSVSDSGGHRILDGSGRSHYIPAGWFHLEWQAFDGAPHFVA